MSHRGTHTTTAAHHAQRRASPINVFIVTAVPLMAGGGGLSIRDFLEWNSG